MLSNLQKMEILCVNTDVVAGVRTTLSTITSSTSKSMLLKCRVAERLQATVRGNNTMKEESTLTANMIAIAKERLRKVQRKGSVTMSPFVTSNHCKSITSNPLNETQSYKPLTEFQKVLRNLRKLSK